MTDPFFKDSVTLELQLRCKRADRRRSEGRPPRHMTSSDASCSLHLFPLRMPRERGLQPGADPKGFRAAGPNRDFPARPRAQPFSHVTHLSTSGGEGWQWGGGLQSGPKSAASQGASVCRAAGKSSHVQWGWGWGGGMRDELDNWKIPPVFTSLTVLFH